MTLYWISLSSGLSLLFFVNGYFLPSRSTSNFDQDWEAWKAKYGKSYISSDEEIYRKTIWTRNVMEVNSHNTAFENGSESYFQTVYGWGDQEQSRSCFKEGTNHLLLYNWTNVDDEYPSHITPLDDIPAEIDYDQSNCVTSVDDQGHCMSCWAIAVVGAIEGVRAKKKGVLQKLSAQQIIDCNAAGDDCTGGNPVNAMIYAKEYGLHAECDYPYVAQKQICQYNFNRVAYKLKNYIGFYYMNEWKLRDYIATIGPGVTHIVITNSFVQYGGGIYSTNECRPEMRPNHSILIVGYGTSEVDGREYWILKNADGPGWGEFGFMRFRRNIGLCAIGTYNFWPGA